MALLQWGVVYRERMRHARRTHTSWNCRGQHSSTAGKTISLYINIYVYLSPSFHPVFVFSSSLLLCFHSLSLCSLSLPSALTSSINNQDQTQTLVWWCSSHVKYTFFPHPQVPGLFICCHPKHKLIKPVTKSFLMLAVSKSWESLFISQLWNKI